MEITNNIWININNLISHTIKDKLAFRKLFNGSCILYGSSLIKLHNNDINIKKLKVLCKSDNYKYIKDFLVYKNDFMEIQTFDRYVFIKPYNRNNSLSVSISIVENPINSVSNYVLLGLEEIYYNGRLIIHKNPKMLITMIENYDGIINDNILKKMKKYVDYGYEFKIEDNGCKIKINNGSKKSILNRLKYMFSLNIKNKNV